MRISATEAFKASGSKTCPLVKRRKDEGCDRGFEWNIFEIRFKEFVDDDDDDVDFSLPNRFDKSEMEGGWAAELDDVEDDAKGSVDGHLEVSAEVDASKAAAAADLLLILVVVAPTLESMAFPSRSSSSSTTPFCHLAKTLG